MKKLLAALAVVIALAGQGFAATTYIYQNVVQNVRGDAIGGAAITVYIANTTTKASIYQYPTDVLGGIANPTYSDTSGRFSFYLLPGRYDIVISGSTITTYTLYDVRIIGLGVGWHDVTDYGAIGSDGRNDADAINDAIEAAAADSGGVVYFPWSEDGYESVGVDSISVANTILDGPSVPTNIQGGAPRILRGVGDPDSVVTAPPSSLYLRNGGSSTANAYIKTAGQDSVGWRPLLTEIIPVRADQPDTAGNRGMLWFSESDSTLYFYNGYGWHALH